MKRKKRATAPPPYLKYVFPFRPLTTTAAAVAAVAAATAAHNNYANKGKLFLRYKILITRYSAGLWIILFLPLQRNNWI